MRGRVRLALERGVPRRGALRRGSGYCTARALAAAALLATPLLALLASPAAGQEPAEDGLIDSLLASMTLEEKAGQLAQFSSVWDAEAGAPTVSDEHRQFIREGKVGSFLGLYGAETTRELQRIAVEESRLGIPLLFAYDVIHGFRTIFPVPLALASSFDPAAVERAARIAAVEATAVGVHWTFGPMVDLSRDPRWGRIVEGFGEDPYLASVLAAASVRGFQGGDSLPIDAPTTVLATAKHFVAYGAPEGGRDYNTVDISERTLREIYLPPFRAAVRAGAASVMAAFNEIGGIPMHAHGRLLTGVLREEWGFDGVVVSDYTGVMEILRHGVAEDSAAAAALALRAGVDIDMVSGIYLRNVPELVRSGRIPEEMVDRSVRRVLEAKQALGLFEDPYRYGDPALEREVILADEHLAAAREIARKSIVLLKNGTRAETGGRRVLPLSKDLGTTAVIGPLADHARSALGSWAAAGRAEDAVTILEGIRQAVSPGTEVVYEKGSEIGEPIDEAAVDPETNGAVGADAAAVGAGGVEQAPDLSADTLLEAATELARTSDAVVLVLGEPQQWSGEAASRAAIEIPSAQQRLARHVLAAAREAGIPAVAVLTNGRPLAIDWLAANAPAILETWYLGVQMGPAVADILFGDYNPGGKLPVTFPRATGQIPIYYNHKTTGRPPGPAPEDKYRSKYLDLPWSPLYPFGYGLSYTDFDYDDLRVSADAISAAELARSDDATGVAAGGPSGGAGHLLVQVDVANTGERAGDEVVQLYIRDDVRSVTPPVRELRGFRRVHLEPGETRTVTFEITTEDLAYWGLDMERIVEPGTFTVFVGGSSVDGLEASFRVTGDPREVGGNDGDTGDGDTGREGTQ